MIELRDYQEAFISDIRSSLSKNKRIITTSPTGSGKGVVLGAISELSARKGSRVLIVSHRIEVVKQNLRQIQKFGTESAIVDAKTKAVPSAPIVVGMAQTLYRRKEKTDWEKFLRSINLLIIDEAHDANMNFLFGCISPKCYVIGLTATPVRYGNQRQLGLDYADIVQGPQVQNLIDIGFLCRCKLYGLDAPKMDDVEWSYDRGDYSLAQMAAKFKSKARYIGVVKNWERICKGTKTIVFCCSSEQTIGICKEFCDHGYNAKYVLSGSFDEDEELSGERKEIMDDFADGKFDILVNFGIGTTGLDVPDIKTVILDFSTTSLTKYLQCLGRASRPHPSKNGEFICLDFGDNFEDLGRYEDDRSWYLWHKKSKGGAAPVKECPEDKGGCGRLIAIQYQDCPFCGYHFPTSEQIYEAELQEIKSSRKNGEEETIPQYVARRKLEGWSNNRILCAVCMKNPDREHEAFLEAIPILRSHYGSKISEEYWYFFKHRILHKNGS
jgi:DNA repair protein RadD